VRIFGAEKYRRPDHPLARSRMAGEGQFDSSTQGDPSGGNAAQLYPSGRPGRTTESGGDLPFRIYPAREALVS